MSYAPVIDFPRQQKYDNYTACVPSFGDKIVQCKVGNPSLPSFYKLFDKSHRKLLVHKCLLLIQ